MATLQVNARAHSEIYAAGHPPGTMPMYPVIFIDMREYRATMAEENLIGC